MELKSFEAFPIEIIAKIFEEFQIISDIKNLRLVSTNWKWYTQEFVRDIATLYPGISVNFLSLFTNIYRCPSVHIKVAELLESNDSYIQILGRHLHLDCFDVVWLDSTPGNYPENANIVLYRRIITWLIDFIRERTRHRDTFRDIRLRWILASSTNPEVHYMIIKYNKGILTYWPEIEDENEVGIEFMQFMRPYFRGCGSIHLDLFDQFTNGFENCPEFTTVVAGEYWARSIDYMVRLCPKLYKIRPSMSSLLENPEAIEEVFVRMCRNEPNPIHCKFKITIPILLSNLEIVVNKFPNVYQLCILHHKSMTIQELNEIKTRYRLDKLIVHIFPPPIQPQVIEITE